MSTKSKVAFQFSLEGMNEKVYFWTFTFAKPHTMRECSKAWGRFWSGWRGLYEVFPNVGGIRVFEEHPGEDNGYGDILSHGWHVHCVFNKRLPVEIVRKIGDRKGIGRMQVHKIPQEAAGYIGKYLAKKRPAYAKGIRLWAPIGLINATKVRDIVVKSRFTQAYHFLGSMIHGWKSLNWTSRLKITQQYMVGDDIMGALKIGICKERYTLAEENAWWDDILESVDQGDL